MNASAGNRHGRATFKRVLTSVMAAFIFASASGSAGVSSNEDQSLVAKLDREYQAAVKINDAKTMNRILSKGMVLVFGDGQIFTRDRLLQEARDKTIIYEHQEEDPGTQTVRVWGNTAVVTARLWLKGVSKGAIINHRLWFSDVYVRTRGGWRYVFGQASLFLPK